MGTACLSQTVLGLEAPEGSAVLHIHAGCSHAGGSLAGAVGTRGLSMWRGLPRSIVAGPGEEHPKNGWFDRQE